MCVMGDNAIAMPCPSRDGVTVQSKEKVPIVATLRVTKMNSKVVESPKASHKERDDVTVLKFGTLVPLIVDATKDGTQQSGSSMMILGSPSKSKMKIIIEKLSATTLAT
ncbi:hypothetical protein ACH5RR_028665 [Cinchona calisaya]|uniref:Uncharacterized protein n=1 Tax=Cinchona calisaya TaxID=153742 RepID=A0ABD2YPF8_9GENT